MTARPQDKSGVPLPREHGAWGLLLQPFVAAIVVTQFLGWLLAPTVALVLLGFAIREPLIVLARQQWVWRNPSPQTPVAVRWFVGELIGISIAIVLLAEHAPLAPFAVLMGIAVLLTVLAVWFTVNNRQRSVLLQLLSAAGLNSTALLVALLATGTIPGWAWLFWAIFTLHAITSILVVRARLRLKTIGRSATPGHPRRTPLLAALVQLLVAGVIMLSASDTAPVLPILFSAFSNAVELNRLGHPATLDEPLGHVGRRALAISIAHALLAIAVFWGVATV